MITCTSYSFGFFRSLNKITLTAIAWMEIFSRVNKTEITIGDDMPPFGALPKTPYTESVLWYRCSDVIRCWFWYHRAPLMPAATTSLHKPAFQALIIMNEATREWRHPTYWYVLYLYLLLLYAYIRMYQYKHT